MANKSHFIYKSIKSDKMSIRFIEYPRSTPKAPMNSFSNKALLLFIVLVAFVDGILVAQHFYENQPVSTEADSVVILEDIFSAGTPQEDPENVNSPIPELKTLPFTVQAPLSTWASPWADYAEEACVWMAYKWATGESVGGPYTIAQELNAIGAYEIATFGTSKLTDIPQTLRILVDFFKLDKAYLSGDLSPAHMQKLLDTDHILILPVNGQLLGNPNYGDPAPKNHMIVLYDYTETHFRANDPGTRRGKAVEYEIQKTLEAIQDLEGERVMMVVGR
jgi:hypothetical protein